MCPHCTVFDLDLNSENSPFERRFFEWIKLIQKLKLRRKAHHKTVVSIACILCPFHSFKSVCVYFTFVNKYRSKDVNDEDDDDIR